MGPFNPATARDVYAGRHRSGKPQGHGALSAAGAAAYAGGLILAGPRTDGNGPGIVEFEADSEAHARDIMLNDPAVKAGLFSAELHRFRALLPRLE